MSAEYKPYDGPTGPSDEQVRDNNIVLGELLVMVGIPFELTNLSDATGVETDTPVKVLKFKIKNRAYTCGYDRWGYVIDQDLRMDQVSLDTVAWWLYEKISC